MQVGKFEELEAIARERYRERYAPESVPEPRVVNADAVIQYAPPRKFEVGGIGLRAPPLSFQNGVRLLVAANAIRDIRTADPPAPPEFFPAAREQAVGFIGQCVTPISPFRRFRGAWLRPFYLMEAEDLELFLRFLVYLPDNGPSGPPSDKPVTVDLIDQAKAITAKWPACADANGLPRLWADYIYGSRHLARARAREDLRMATMFRIAQGADKHEWKSFLADEQSAAGW